MMTATRRASVEALKLQVKKRPVDKKNIRSALEKKKSQEIYKCALSIGINLRMTDETEQDTYYKDLVLMYILK